MTGSHQSGFGVRTPAPFSFTQAPKRTAARARAFAASSSRFLGEAVVSSECSRRAEAAATSSTAVSNGASLAFEGLLKPQIFLTNCRDAARISSSVTGGSKLNKVLMFLHIGGNPTYRNRCAERMENESTRPQQGWRTLFAASSLNWCVRDRRYEVWFRGPVWQVRRRGRWCSESSFHRSQ